MACTRARSLRVVALVAVATLCLGGGGHDFANPLPAPRPSMLRASDRLSRLAAKRRIVMMRALLSFGRAPVQLPWWRRPLTLLAVLGVALAAVAALKLLGPTRQGRRENVLQRLEASAGSLSSQSLQKPRVQKEQERLAEQAASRSAAEAAARAEEELRKAEAERAAAVAAAKAEEEQKQAVAAAARAEEEQKQATAAAAKAKEEDTIANAAAAAQVAGEAAGQEAAQSKESETKIADKALATTKVGAEFKDSVLDDGRTVSVFPTETEAEIALVAKTASIARAAISEKGAFSMAVSGTSINKGLATLSRQPNLDFSKFHVFFCYDTVGTQTCYQEAQELWIKACGIPAAQVHPVGDIPGEGGAAQNTAAICMQEENVVADSPEGLPSVDLVLLEAGPDGSCGGLVPDGEEAAKAEAGQVVLALESPPAIAVSMDFIQASAHALVAAFPGTCAGAVRTALSEPSSSSCPVGAVRAQQSTTWLVTTASIEEYHQSVEQ